MNTPIHQPSSAFVGMSWAAFFIGAIAFVTGLWNAAMQLNENGCDFIVLVFGLFAVVSLQKSVCDRLDGIAVTGMYFGLCWLSVILSLCFLTVGLWNATLAFSEKGFYGMAFVWSLYSAVAVQKNTRDLAAFETGRRAD